MILFIWFVSGSLVISTSFLITYHFTSDYWFAGEVSSILSGVLLLAFMIYITRRPFPRKLRFELIVAYVLLVILLSFGWHGSKVGHKWQKDALMTLKKSIDEEMFKTSLHNILLMTMHIYYHRGDTLITLKDAFEHKEPKKLLEDWQEISGWDSLTMHVAATNDSIMLVWQDNFLSGNDSTYKNYNGRIGKRQFTAILTENGIKYEQNN